ncbi:hypothetical protein [Pseudomonas sp. RA_105y_Pfl2_P56]|uniref:hypothetical protein n=1 Tax=Pseudomonas sp. RA_105y_Pfl2_P56 TaxID=3088701 RepID=UPI0030DBB166
MKGKKTDLLGRLFGRLTVTEESPSVGRKAHWMCRCECGTVKVVGADALTRGATLSCGCLKKELATTHGLFGHELYQTWANMRDRCENEKCKDFPNYGARGIRVCDEWKDFAVFVSDMGSRPKGHTIERVDGSMGYSPGNCVWATTQTQNRNKRTNLTLRLGDTEMCASRWAEQTGIPLHVICERKAIGWSDEDAVTKSVRRYTKKTA